MATCYPVIPRRSALSKAVLWLVGTLMLASCGGTTRPAPGFAAYERGEYTPEPYLTCESCDGSGASPEGVPCCTAAFETECQRTRGLLVRRDLHPSAKHWLGCYQRAPDSGKPCAADGECAAVHCDLGAAIDTKRCKLLERDDGPTALEIRSWCSGFGDDWSVENYSCVEPRPGRCSDSSRNATPSPRAPECRNVDGTILTIVRGSAVVM